MSSMSLWDSRVSGLFAISCLSSRFKYNITKESINYFRFFIFYIKKKKETFINQTLEIYPTSLFRYSLSRGVAKCYKMLYIARSSSCYKTLNTPRSRVCWKILNTPRSCVCYKMLNTPSLMYVTKRLIHRGLVHVTKQWIHRGLVYVTKCWIHRGLVYVTIKPHVL